MRKQRNNKERENDKLSDNTNSNWSVVVAIQYLRNDDRWAHQTDYQHCSYSLRGVVHPSCVRIIQKGGCASSTSGNTHFVRGKEELRTRVEVLSTN